MHHEPTVVLVEKQVGMRFCQGFGALPRWARLSLAPTSANFALKIASFQTTPSCNFYAACCFSKKLSQSGGYCTMTPACVGVPRSIGHNKLRCTTRQCRSSHCGIAPATH